MCIFRRAAYLLCLPVLLVISQQSTAALDLEYNPTPRRLGQIEYVRVSEFPGHWEADELKSYLFYSLDDPSSRCGSYPNRVTHRCLSAFDGKVEFDSKFGDIRRLSYKALPEFSGKMYISVAIANITQRAFAFSPIGMIDFDARPDEAFIPRPTIFDATEPYLPVRNTSTQGDICIDGTNGDDRNSGFCPNAPVKTIRRGLTRFQSHFPTAETRAGKHILIRGGTYREGISLVDWRGLAGQPITVRGYPGERVVLSLWTQSPEEYRRRHGTLPGDRQTWYDEILGGFYGVNLTGAKHVVLENIAVEGARVEGVNPDNTEDVKIRFVEVHSSGRWGIQAFGALKDLVIEGCLTTATSNTWSAEHGIYIAPLKGPGEPLSSGVQLRSNTSVANERFGIQVNGAVRDVLIENNVSIGNKLGGFSVYGVTGGVVRNNIAALNHQQPLVVYNMFDTAYLHRGYGPDPLGGSKNDAAYFGQTRNRTSAYLTIAHNTFIAGPDAPFSGALDPSWMESIKLVEGIGRDIHGDSLGEPFFDIDVSNNMLVTSNRRALNLSVTNQERDSRGYRMIEGVRVRNNFIFTNTDNARVKLPWESNSSLYTKISDMQEDYPDNWSQNVLGQAPHFTRTVSAPAFSGIMDLREYVPTLLQGDYSLLAHSAAIDRAREVSYSSGINRQLSTDINGVPRVHGGAGDIGAFEREL